MTEDKAALLRSLTIDRTATRRGRPAGVGRC